MNIPTDRPRYNICDGCGRRQHKVAIRRHVDIYGRPLAPADQVVGLCPTCIKRPNWADELTNGTATLIYDRRKRS